MVSLFIFDFRFSICAFVFFPLLLPKEDRMSLLSFTQTRKEDMTINCYGMNFDYLFFFLFFFLKASLVPGEWDNLFYMSIT